MDASLQEEIERASISVRRLGSLLFEMEVLRSFLDDESDIQYFDTRVNPAKLETYNAIKKIRGTVKL